MEKQYDLVGIIPSEDENMFHLNKAYIDFALKFGKNYKIIMSSQDVKNCGLLLITGGRDIDPTIFGQDNYNSVNPYVEMDYKWMSYITTAVDNNIDLFGICRGFQLLYYMFLRYEKHLYYEQHIGYHNQNSNNVLRKYFSHKVTNIRTGEVIKVNSLHHQAVLRSVPTNNDYVLYTTKFGCNKNEEVVEGIKFTLNNTVKVLAVQWHPEELDDDANSNLYTEWENF